MDYDKPNPIYDFSQPKGVARYLLSLPKRHRAGWVRYFEREKGEEFVQQCRKEAEGMKGD